MSRNWQNVPTNETRGRHHQIDGPRPPRPGQRFITGYDLSLEDKQEQRPACPSSAISNFTLIRSRAEVAYGRMRRREGASRRHEQGVDRWLAPCVEVGTQAVSRLAEIARFASASSVARSTAKDRGRTNRRRVPGGGQQINDQIDRTEIPVAEQRLCPGLHARALRRRASACCCTWHNVFCIFMTLYGLIRIHLGRGHAACWTPHLRQFHWRHARGLHHP